MGWLDDAVVYQVYMRSFADGNGDGVGDLSGVRAHLDHIAALGVDAIWLSPCFRSPQRDHGYDVSDYRDIDPLFGTLSELDELVAAAHARNLKIVLDLVPNHCSTEHAWFQEALAAGPGSAARARFHFADGKGDDGSQPPNNWQSVFGGPAWTRAADGQWYLHSFDSSQPDFNWDNDDVVDMMDGVLRFWFERGVDGFRVDVAHGLVKEPGLPDWPGGPGTHNIYMWNRPGVHDIYRRWRATADEFGACFVGEVWVASSEELREYASPQELGQAFHFDLLVRPWHAPSLREAIESGLHDGVAWALANHDVHRPATRYGQAQIIEAPDPTDMLASARRTGPVDVALGRRRAVAATMLMLALPGAAYLYQGDELALPEVLDLPDETRQDPIWLRSGGSELGRDGCRVPLPWTAEPPTFGFTTAAATWLPQPAWFAAMSVAVEEADHGSALHATRAALRLRRGSFQGGVEWLGSPDGVLALRRGSGICVLNAAPAPVELPAAWGAIQTSSAPVSGRTLPPDTCAWLTVGEIADGDVHPPMPAAAGATKES